MCCTSCVKRYQAFVPSLLFVVVMQEESLGMRLLSSPVIQVVDIACSCIAMLHSQCRLTGLYKASIGVTIGHTVGDQCLRSWGNHMKHGKIVFIIFSTIRKGSVGPITVSYYHWT